MEVLEGSDVAPSLRFGTIERTEVEEVMWSLKVKIEKDAHTYKELKTDSLAHTGLALLSSPHHWKPHFSDVKIYLESCMALQLNRDTPDASE